MPSTRAVRGIVASLTALGLIAAGFSAAAPAAASGRRVHVPAARPAWATTAADEGPLPDSVAVQVQLALELPDEQAARDFALSVSTPGSADYRRFLSPEQWIERFAPTQEALDQVVDGLGAAGLQVESVPRSRLFVTLSGSAATVDAYFATRLHAFEVDGATQVAATQAATLPAQVGQHVQAVTFQHPRITTGPRAERSATEPACSRWWKQRTVRIPKAYGITTASTPLCGYSAKQLRAVADVSGSPLTGAGQTIAVIGAFGSSTMRRDLATYSKRNGLPAADYTEVLPAAKDLEPSFACVPEDWQAEQALDLEAIHATAPRARLVYVGAADCGAGFDTAMSRVLDDGLASIVSNSWGATALDTLAATDLVDDATRQSIVVNLHQHLQAAGQGVGLYFASGDYGDDRVLLGRKAVDFPASSPFVTAVGGTAAALDRSGKRLWTSPWGEQVATRSAESGARWSPSLPGGFIGGAGGGTSTLFAAPAYQSGVVPTALSHGRRASTDVAALAASSTGFAVGLRPIGRPGKYVTAAAGGTSLATPIVAAQVALAQQASGRRLGFLNPALYALAQRSPGAFRDVRPSARRRVVATRAGGQTLLITLDRDSSLKARQGYDLPTGLGELTRRALTALGRL